MARKVLHPVLVLFEKDLGVSYPTVRRNLDQVIVALGYNVKTEEEEVNKKDILEKLSKGELTSEEALKKLGAAVPQDEGQDGGTGDGAGNKERAA